MFGKLATNYTPGFIKDGGPAYQMAYVVTVGGTASWIAGGKFANGAETAAYGYIFNHLFSLGFSGRIPFIGGARFALGVSYHEGEWDAGLAIDSDVPKVHAGKMIARGALEIGYEKGDFRTNHGEQSYVATAGAKGVGISVTTGKDGPQGVSISIGPQLGVEVSAQQTRTISLRYDIIPAIERVRDRVGGLLR